MIHFYLIRHGQKENSRPDPALTETGHQQAQKTGSFFTKLPISRILASPKKRTRQTAQHIADAIHVAIEHDPRLVERMDLGDDEITRDQFFREWQRATRDRTYLPPFGDSSEQTGKRVAHVLNEIEDEGDREQHIAVITHGGAIADFLRTMFPEVDLSSLHFSFPDGQDFKIDECSITHITKRGNTYQLTELHSTKHLDGLS